MTYFIDSHTHITNEELDVNVYLEDVARAKEIGIKKAMMVYTFKEELDKTYPILSNDEYFDFAYGIYPSDTTEIKEEWFEDLKQVLTNGKFKALGEIGLDYHWYPDNKEIQKEIFRRQVALADELNLPIIIHARDAIQDTYDILKSTPCKRKGVMHCYSGSAEMAVEFIKLGYYVSFSGTITFKNNRRGIETLNAIDKNYLLCETDAPYLTPVPYRGKRNETMYVKNVYEFIANELNMDIKELKQLVQTNYYNLFGH